jgi:hypothetical protein
MLIEAQAGPTCVTTNAAENRQDCDATGTMPKRADLRRQNQTRRRLAETGRPTCSNDPPQQWGLLLSTARHTAGGPSNKTSNDPPQQWGLLLSTARNSSWWALENTRKHRHRADNLRIRAQKGPTCVTTNAAETGNCESTDQCPNGGRPAQT